MIELNEKQLLEVSGGIDTCECDGKFLGGLDKSHYDAYCIAKCCGPESNGKNYHIKHTGRTVSSISGICKGHERDGESLARRDSFWRSTTVYAPILTMNAIQWGTH